MIKFLLNNNIVSTLLPAGTLLLDFVRYHQHLHGTKIGCREGDCGACTVLVGSLNTQGQVVYRSATSCLMPIGNAQGKHIVTVEGTNIQGLNFIQQAFSNEGASQCGFCTPGFMVSLAGFCLQANEEPTYEQGIDAVNGNICRCTGYKSIERAIGTIANKLTTRQQESAVDFAVNNQILPEYFKQIPDKLMALQTELSVMPNNPALPMSIVGGGTDLYVQKHDSMTERNDLYFAQRESHLSEIAQVNDLCFLGSGTTVTDIAESPIFNTHFEEWQAVIKLVSSTPIRNMATLAGNFINASPIGDFSILFLALDAQLQFASMGNTQARQLPLRKLYKGYKQLDKQPDEYVERIFFQLPDAQTKVNFEKVCKRTHLDIASVNTAICLHLHSDGTIAKAGLSAGGVAPVPAFLPKTSAYMEGKVPSRQLLNEVCALAQTEIAPIGDVRGSVAYKRLLLNQLIEAHFIKLFPQL